MTNPNVTISPITLHLVEDIEEYEEHPKVGIVARATITVNAAGYRRLGLSPMPDCCAVVTELFSLSVKSRGVWGIECPDLVAGYPVPEGSWVIGDLGNHQIDEVRAAIRALLAPTPEGT